ncbi:MAG TPA: hypothetical protein VFB22_09105 [Candidatus Baltobacteraceae bacterium]|nr:hypothetical protein [Candidatus Baltobacteraceae bacterium]
MPSESRLFLRTSLIALVLAFLWGAAMAAGEALGIAPPSMWPVEHAHLAFVGWLVNLVIGIAWWMLPLNRDRFPETAGRYPRWAPPTVWILLNAGLVARIAAEPALSFAVARPVLIAGGVAQAAAIVLFAACAWHRVRAPARPAPGVR